MDAPVVLDTLVAELIALTLDGKLQWSYVEGGSIITTVRGCRFQVNTSGGIPRLWIGPNDASGNTSDLVQRLYQILRPDPKLQSAMQALREEYASPTVSFDLRSMFPPGTA